MPMKYEGFSRLLNYKVFVERKHSIADLSKLTGIPESTLYKWAEGYNTPPVDVVALIYNASKDIDYPNFVIRDTDLMLTPRQKPVESKGLNLEIMDITPALGKLVEGIIHANKPRDRVIRDFEKLQQEIEEAKKAYLEENKD